MKLDSKKACYTPLVKPVTLASGNTAHVRVMAGKDRDSWNDIIRGEQNNPSGIVERVYAALIVRTLCDESGKRVFANDEQAEVAEQMNANDIEGLFSIAYDANKIGESGVKAAKKNFAASVCSGFVSLGIWVCQFPRRWSK